MTSELHQLMPVDQPYWVMHREDEDSPWRRDRLVGWGLLVDQAEGGDPMRYVVGLVVDRDGASVTPAPPGRLMAQLDWDALGPCTCTHPKPSPMEAWCTLCGSEVAS